MFYKIKDDVFLVGGAFYSCIYHLPNNALYQIDRNTFDFINDILSREVSDQDEISMLEDLVQLGVIEKCSAITRPLSIDEYLQHHRPFSLVWIELTNICNLKCIHCYNEKTLIKKHTLTISDFKYIVDELQKNDVHKVTLIGGEPFVLKKDLLFEMMDYLSPRIDSFEIFTNGTLVSEQDLHEIKFRYPNASIATSLHSYIESEQDRVTQCGGSYKKTVSTIRNAQRIDLQVRYVGTLMAPLDIGTELEFGKPSRRDYVRLSGKASLKLYDKTLLKEKAIIKDNFVFSDLRKRVLDTYNDSCYATHLYISSDMEVYPCPMERRISHGNLRNASLSDLLNPSILNMSKKEVNECRECEYRYICLDCRPDSITNDIAEKPWFCTYKPLRGEWENFDYFADKLGITNIVE